MTVRVYLHRHDKHALSPAGDWHIKEMWALGKFHDAYVVGMDENGVLAMWMEFESEEEAALFKLTHL